MQVEMLDSMVVNRQDQKIGEIVTVDKDLGTHLIRAGWATEHIALVPVVEDVPTTAKKRRTVYHNPDLSTTTQPSTEES
jgi:hypothetical protein